MSRRTTPQSMPTALSQSFSHSGTGIIGSALQMISRLRDHVERMDNGVVYAVDDLAVVLRALLCHGKGNGVLRRLYDECGINKPSVLLSRAPAGDANVQFSVGSIPTREVGAVADGAVYMPLSKWPNREVLVVTLERKQRRYTWDVLLSEYANKWGGAHLDVTVPSHLQFTDLYAAGGLNLTGYLLRSAAIEVWLLAQSAFIKILHNQATSALTPQQLEKVRYTADGGISSDPRDISSRGQLQWFCHGTEQLGLLWYIDGSSQDNALRLQLGRVPYDVRYSPKASPEGGQSIPVVFQAPRHAPREGPIAVDRNALKTLTLNGQVRTLLEVRSAALP
jgi:hypothetical protein